eukprot:m.212164 g.212164  ORF g.212164 m.212164 type:complete len:222 (+) comp15071_c0_seq5:61-726(+)
MYVHGVHDNCNADNCAVILCQPTCLSLTACLRLRLRLAVCCCCTRRAVVGVGIQLLSQLKPQVKSSINELVQLCNGKDMNVFQEKLSAQMDQSQLFVRPLDKRRERELMLQLSHALESQIKALNEDSDISTALLLVLTALLNSKCQLCLHVHGRCIPALIPLVLAQLSDEEAGTLKQAQTMVYDALTRQASKEGSEEADLESSTEPVAFPFSAMKKLVLKD